MVYICMICDEFFDSDKKPGKVEEGGSNPALCPICNSDEVREGSYREVEKYNKWKVEYDI